MAEEQSHYTRKIRRKAVAVRISETGADGHLSCGLEMHLGGRGRPWAAWLAFAISDPMIAISTPGLGLLYHGSLLRRFGLHQRCDHRGVLELKNNGCDQCADLRFPQTYQCKLSLANATSRKTNPFTIKSPQIGTSDSRPSNWPLKKISPHSGCRP